MPRRKSECPRSRRVVRSRLRRHVHRRVRHRHRLLAGRCQSHLEPGRVPLLDRRASDGQLRPVVVRDPPLTGSVSQSGPRRIAQGHPEAFLRLVESVVRSRHEDPLDCLPRPEGQRIRLRRVVRSRLRRHVRRCEVHRHRLLAGRCQPHPELSRVPLHDRGILDRQLRQGASAVAIVVDDPHRHLGYPVQGRRAIGVLVPHFMGELHQLILIVGVLHCPDRDPSGRRCHSRVAVVLIEFPADRRCPANAFISFGLVKSPVVTHNSVDVHPDPPSVGARLPSQPQVVGGRFSLPDLQRGRRHLYFPWPREDRGVVLGMGPRRCRAGQQRRHEHGGDYQTPEARAPGQSLFQPTNEPAADQQAGYVRHSGLWVRNSRGKAFPNVHTNN